MKILIIIILIFAIGMIFIGGVGLYHLIQIDSKIIKKQTKQTGVNIFKNANKHFEWDRIMQLHWKGMTNEEICDILGCSKKKVKDAIILWKSLH